jgi:hypothetical protein
MVFTASGSRLDAAGAPIDHTETPLPLGSRPMVIPTPDPAFYLRISGLPGVGFDAYGRLNSPPGVVTVSVHAAGDGSSRLVVYGLDEMTTSAKVED